MKFPATALAIFVSTMIGCQGNVETNSESTNSETVVMDGPPPESIDMHPEHGPHGGELIELGQETYHGELIHTAEKVTIYVLDGSATEMVPIAAPTLTVSLKHDGAVQSFDVSADSDTDDPDGKSSRFVSTDATLCEWMQHDAEGAVIIEIEGKMYNGEITHHDHDHDHDH
tara:strand:- start:99730 stop:100242 length:513 start_codon:yes stop_codon:yes gene_type:complete